MKFALDTCKAVWSGNADQRVRALSTFGVWFAAGAFTVSTITHYVAPFEGMAVDVVGGFAFALVAMTAKLV